MFDKINRLYIKALVFALIAILGGYTVAAESDDVAQRKAVRAVIEQQLKAFKDDDYEKAYSFAASSVKQIFASSEHFAQMVRSQYHPIFRSASYFFVRDDLTEGDAMQEVIITDDKGALWQAVYSLQKKADKPWKINSVLLAPYRGKSI